MLKFPNLIKSYLGFLVRFKKKKHIRFFEENSCIEKSVVYTFISYGK